MENNNCVISILAKDYGFELTDFCYGSMFEKQCTMWRTKYPFIFITDYDVKLDQDLKEKDCVMLYYDNNSMKAQQMISVVLLKQENLFIMALDEFNKNFNKK